jgi:ppGpp synthetase/RelA/SpoT-type nucleotidyltranferase
METITNTIKNHENDFNTVKSSLTNILNSIKDKYIVWFQARLKSPESLYEKIYKRNYSLADINDIIAFRIIYPWTKSLHEIADILKTYKELYIYKTKITEQNKVIYLYGKTESNNNFEIQLWPTLIYTCFEFEHNKIYKPKQPPTTEQLESAQYVRSKEHALQNIIDQSILVPYDS